MRINSFIQKRFYFFILIFFWIIFALPYIFQQKVPYPSTFQVNHFPPWSYYQELFASPVKNAAMPDIVDQIYPWRHLSVEIWKSGQVPLWNPYNFAGNPLLANFQSAVFSVVNLLFFVLPFIDAWSVIVLSQPLIMGVSTYALMREYKRSKEASTISAISAMFCGFLVVWMAYGTLSLAFSFLPLSLMFIEKFKNSQKTKYLFLLSLTVPLSYFSGHFQTSIYVSFFVISYLLFNFIFYSRRSLALWLILAYFLGFLMCFIQILPSVELYSYSVRSEIFNNSGGIPIKYLITSFAPDFFGNPVTRNDWFGYYAEWSSFIGIIPLVLAFLNIVFWRKAAKEAKYFVIFAIVVLILALQSPLQTLIGNLKIPVISTSNPTRIISLFSFSLALLSGFGFDQFLEEKGRKCRRIFLLLALVLVFMMVLWALLQLNSFIPKEHIHVAKRNLILPTLLFLSSAILISLSIVFKSKKLFGILSILLIILVGFDSLRFASKWIPFEDKSKVFPDVKIIPQLQKELGTFRYFGNLGAQVASYYKLASLDGYDPLYIQKYGEFVQSSINGSYQEAQRSVVSVSRTGSNTDRILNITGAKLIFHPKADTNQPWAYPVWEKREQLLKTYEDERFELYTNTYALPRFALFYRYDVAQGKEILKKFYDPNFDYTQKLILDKNIEYQPILGTGSAKITSYTANKVIGDVTTDQRALLFLADNYYPGWKALIDGKETTLYRANYTFRAILVPRGKHKIEFIYDPISFKIGSAVSFVGLQGVFIMSVVYYFRRKKYN